MDLDLEWTIKGKIAAAPFGSDERNILRLILGEIAYNGTTSNKSGKAILQDLLKQNEISAKKCRFNQSEMARIKLENKLIKSLLGQ